MSVGTIGQERKVFGLLVRSYVIVRFARARATKVQAVSAHTTLINNFLTTRIAYCSNARGADDFFDGGYQLYPAYIKKSAVWHDSIGMELGGILFTFFRGVLPGCLTDIRAWRYPVGIAICGMDEGHSNFAIIFDP